MHEVSSDIIRKLLVKNGWSKEVAGADFDTAVNAICAMYKSGRGLFVTGKAGCGKTALIESLRKIMGKDTSYWYYCKEPKDVEYLRSNTDDILCDSIFLDDIGVEEIAKIYGNTVDAVGDFIQRYHYRGMGRFIATTNLDSAQINERYGGRVLDRILEMCVVLTLKGNSKRERMVF